MSNSYAWSDKELKQDQTEFLSTAAYVKQQNLLGMTAFTPSFKNGWWQYNGAHENTLSFKLKRSWDLRGCSMWYNQWLREVCSMKLSNIPIILLGSGVIVKIDESQFKHKPNINKILLNWFDKKFKLNCNWVVCDHQFQHPECELFENLLIYM